MAIEAYLGVTVKTRNKITLVRRLTKSRSFVRGFNHVLCAQMRGQVAPAPAIQTTDTAGVLQSLRTASSAFWCNADVAEDFYGPVIGTDNTPVDIEDYALGAQCTEGTGANQVNHRETLVTYMGVVGAVSQFKLDRTFLNNSGNVINVEEIGLYIRAMRTGAVAINILGLRDLNSVAVPDGGGITVTYYVGIVA